MSEVFIQSFLKILCSNWCSSFCLWLHGFNKISKQKW